MLSDWYASDYLETALLRIFLTIATIDKLLPGKYNALKAHRAVIWSTPFCLDCCVETVVLHVVSLHTSAASCTLHVVLPELVNLQLRSAMAVGSVCVNKSCRLFHAAVFDEVCKPSIYAGGNEQQRDKLSDSTSGSMSSCTGEGAESHSSALQELCRVCGRPLTHQRVAYNCKEHTQKLECTFGITVANDNRQIHPPNFCSSCHRSTLTQKTVARNTTMQ